MGSEALELLENSVLRTDLSVGYNPAALYQHRSGFLFSGNVVHQWDVGLNSVNIRPEDLPVVGISSYFPSLEALDAHRERCLLRWLNDGVHIAPTKLAEGIGQHILGDETIREFHDTHELLEVAPEIAKKLGSLFYKAQDGTVVSVNAPQLAMPELTDEYRNQVYIRQRFDSVEHMVRWLAYWDATTIPKRSKRSR